MSTAINAIIGIRRPAFYSVVREKLFKGSITVKQVAGIEAVLNEWERLRLADLRWLAYMLATAFHETAQTMQAIAEYGKGRDYDYGRQLKMGGGKGKRIPYTLPKQLYYGRGLVQLTWYENYQLFSRLLGIDLLNNPDQALQLDVAVKIMFEGMMKASSSFGDFTGRCLEQYFNHDTEDWVNARKIINGLDCAAAIAGHAKTFYDALKRAV